jgi:hypothetical protein
MDPNHDWVSQCKNKWGKGQTGGKKFIAKIIQNNEIISLKGTPN